MALNAILGDKDDIGQHFERLRADMATLTETVRRLASDAAQGAQSQANDAAKSAAHGAAAAGQRLYKDAAALQRDAANAAAATVDRVEVQIARNPATALLVALGLGLAIGLLSRRL